MVDPEKRPIFIVKKKKHGHGGHGGAWKVAFADFVTAMMALFMVLWLVAQSPTTKSAVGAYFRDPLGIESGGNTEVNTGPNNGGAGFFAGGNTAVAVDTTFAASNGADRSPTKEIPELSEARSRLTQALMALSMDSWARHVELSAVDEGLRIEIEDSETLHLFAHGSARINPSAHALLRSLAIELRALPNRFVIEGYTDATPAGGRASNWELSMDRAHATRRFLMQAGTREEQLLEVRGYADRRPKLLHAPKDPRNRRVTILVLADRRPREDPVAVEPLEHPLIHRLREAGRSERGPELAVPVSTSPGRHPARDD